MKVRLQADYESYLKKLTIVAILLALVAWVHPIQATAETKINFELDPTLNQPIVLYGPVLPPNISVSPTTTPPLKRRTVVSNLVSKKANVYRGRNNACSCVLFAKAQTGYSAPVGAARNWPINTYNPQIGAVVVTSESSLGHVAVVTDIQGNYLTVIEANYSRCKITTRTIPITYSRIKGYYK